MKGIGRKVMPLNGFRPPKHDNWWRGAVEVVSNAICSCLAKDGDHMGVPIKHLTEVLERGPPSSVWWPVV